MDDSDSPRRPLNPLAFTSRDLFLGVGIVAMLLGAYLMFWLYIAVPFALGIAIVLGRWGRRNERRAYILASRILFWPASVSSAFLLLVNFTGHGPVWQSDRWPWAIGEIALAANADPRGARVYCHYVDFLDAEYVWRQRIPRAKIGQLVSKCQFTECMTPPPEWDVRQFPGWWRPVERSENRFFWGYFGKNYTVMMYDPPSEWLYVWHYWDW